MHWDKHVKQVHSNMKGVNSENRESHHTPHEMANKVETIQEFYTRKFGWMPENIRSEIGHFNIFHYEPYVEGKPTTIPYRRRDFYKIMLVKGNSPVYFADKVVQVRKQALTFSNPLIPYKWENLDRISDGVYCIFNQHFFHNYGLLTQYEVFQPGKAHVFELTDAEVTQVSEIFAKMEAEFSSEYKYKHDVLRNMVFELLHFGLKMQPSESLGTQTINASQRITAMFLELLERQFPVDESHQKVNLRTASDFAGQLAVHVNHLNHAVRETANKTTTQVIAERFVQEAKVLLRHSHWNVSEIAHALGFNEVTHFDNFFKKHTRLSPLKFRNRKV